MEVIFAGSQKGHPSLVFSSHFLVSRYFLFLLLLLTPQNFISTSLKSKSLLPPKNDRVSGPQTIAGSCGALSLHVTYPYGSPVLLHYWSPELAGIITLEP